MRLHRAIFVFFISFILLYPFLAKAQVPPPFEIQKAVTVEEVRQFIDEYIARFMKLDLEPFMELFSKRALENKMLLYADIRDAYQKTIAGSRSIGYSLKIYSIQTDTRSALVRGRYEIVQTLRRVGRQF